MNYSPIFEQFWATYPRQEGKLDAWNAWRSASHFNTASTIIAGAARYRDNPHRNPQFTKTPARWLESRGWEDGPAEPPRLQQPDPTYKPGWQKRLEYNAQLNQQYQDPGAEFLRSIEQ
ncbi:hypothetical protein ACN082_09910 [Rothia sp. CCM 9417]|uniref:hypothetical protein n=1 Tax=Rothia sp. CCM 9417 TaxID=3402657 RepID=UPI003AE33A3B